MCVLFPEGLLDAGTTGVQFHQLKCVIYSHSVLPAILEGTGHFLIWINLELAHGTLKSGECFVGSYPERFLFRLEIQSRERKCMCVGDKYEERKVRRQNHQNKLEIKTGWKVRFSKDLEMITELTELISGEPTWGRC